MKKQKAFTLIELLVVIAIIGLLATIVLISLNSARSKARNARTKGDIHQIILALELYYDDNGSYPSSDGTWRCLKPSGNCWKGGYVADADIVSALAPYMASIPKTQAKSGCYLYDAYLYHGSHPGVGSYPAGAYIIWAKENEAFGSAECPGYLGNGGNPYDCNDYHCYQFIGVN
jgi:type II secretion system protein G